MQTAVIAWGDVASVLGGLAVLLLLLAAYFIPVLIAYGRGHDQLTLIVVLDVCFGWTVLGWLVALLWSLTAIEPGPAAAPFRRRPPTK